MPSTLINGVNLYFEIYGSGSPLMLIAGLGSDSQSWQPIIKDLSRHHRVIIPDNRGIGRTMPQDIETSIQMIADDCIALIKYLGLSSANLVGHSMGGFVALDCAIRYPECVSRLILAGTSAFNSPRNNALFRDWASYLESGMNIEHWFRNLFYWIFTERFFDNQSGLNDALKFAIEYPYPQSKIAFAQQVNAIEAFNCLESLPSINIKTLIVCGKEDLLFPYPESFGVLRAIPRSIMSVIENAAHAIHMENPKAFTHCVLNFLAAV